ncbi:dihydroxyacetone kinase subunit DhaL [Chelativorans sp. M5D2P16]|uniref:dihydroxyacetone kinase subunit DhaL n=1 Tax=Chelativorans sp. M5D2P16 TaxID=3095678 RepID=UPI002ACA2611|nr:dihydroxyacetone kinase subunit DhaL [Chelativorans sp. M5D2P16]MDZ5700114.1 dihydroxyacetone kinase subunit DhaL [Chelativorans sp. M5D2P16]
MSGNQARELASMFYAISEAIEAEKDFLTRLDGAIGDADHGISMSAGFLAVNAALSKLDMDRCAPADVFATAANAFLNAVGASTGPLYATAFLRAAAAARQSERLDGAFLCAMFTAIADGIRERGKGTRGDKTMLDAWLPAAEAAHAARRRGAALSQIAREAAQAAAAGAAATRAMIASRGRAARVGDRSLGHVDPGAASAKIIIEAIGEHFGEPVEAESRSGA